MTSAVSWPAPTRSWFEPPSPAFAVEVHHRSIHVKYIEMPFRLTDDLIHPYACALHQAAKDNELLGRPIAMTDRGESRG